MFAGTNTGPSNSNPAFQKRPKEEEWDPEYTPKSKKYFLVGAILLCMDLFFKSCLAREFYKAAPVISSDLNQDLCKHPNLCLLLCLHKLLENDFVTSL